jgi:hypothetical protein
MGIRKLVLGFLVLGIFQPAQAKPLPRYGVFVYSNLCWEKESGDAAGNRIMLIRDGDGDRLFFEWSDGPLESPVQAIKLSLDGNAGQIAFSVDIGSQDSVDGQGNFVRKEKPYVLALRGKIDDAQMTLEGGDMKGPELLPRLRDFGAKMGWCR